MAGHGVRCHFRRVFVVHSPQYVFYVNVVCVCVSVLAHIISLLTLYHFLVNQKLPHTMSPEYQAATRAYMRYHNMNPIFGVSSK